MNLEIGSEEAKANFLELLSGVQIGKRYTIMLHGQAVANLVPAEDIVKASAMAAAEDMLSFMRARNLACSVGMKGLINEGRS